jgi:hypothetical protein
MCYKDTPNERVIDKEIGSGPAATSHKKTEKNTRNKNIPDRQ